MKPIHIEIWSDLVCPFCYIGKRNLENALARFPGRERVSVTWKSFQLDPRPERDPGKGLNERIAEKYGRTIKWAEDLSDQVTEVARQAGLAFRLDRAIPANTRLAHQLAHAAARRGLQDRAEEALMSAYFTEGRNLGDPAELARIGTSIGLTDEEVRQALDEQTFAADVARDEEEARRIGIRAVPFFLFNREVPVAGAQPPDAFLAALEEVSADQRA